MSILVMANKRPVVALSNEYHHGVYELTPAAFEAVKKQLEEGEGIKYIQVDGKKISADPITPWRVACRGVKDPSPSDWAKARRGAVDVYDDGDGYSQERFYLGVTLDGEKVVCWTTEKVGGY